MSVRIEHLLGLIDGLNEWVGRLMSPLILVLMGMGLWEIMLRYVFSMPTIWSHEASAMLFGAYWMVGGAYSLRHQAHINCDVIYRRFTPRGRAVLDLVSFPLVFIFCGLLLWQGWRMFSTSLLLSEHTSSVWGPPWYPLKLTIAIGAFLMLLQVLAKFVRDLAIAATGRETA